MALTADFARAGEDCGDVSIAELNWASAGLAAWVDRLILETGFGCAVSLIEGDNESTVETIIEIRAAGCYPRVLVRKRHTGF
nr:hypothetical protein [Marinicella sp. W31]MDC2877226.1 hypothetical protein [Marinicella sp. W31]